MSDLNFPKVDNHFLDVCNISFERWI